MKVSDLDFFYPDELVATAPAWPPRVMAGLSSGPLECGWDGLLDFFHAGDLLVINETKVLRRRIFAGAFEILFLNSDDQKTWQVLFPSKKLNIGDEISLPLGVRAKLKMKGRPQVIETSESLDEKFFEQVGELPLPPYIQKARQERHNRSEDHRWYQTAWAERPGSFAAPTASLHFRSEDIQKLREKGVQIQKITLHVGLGTFLPVKAEDLNQHEMHFEWCDVPAGAWEAIMATKQQGGTVWAMGTTVARALESAGQGLLLSHQGGFHGETNLLIQPGYRWQIVDGLLTNFHQPRSTLLALVAAFAGLDAVKTCYSWAIERRFRLFSYGDLTLWKK